MERIIITPNGKHRQIKDVTIRALTTFDGVKQIPKNINVYKTTSFVPLTLLGQHAIDKMPIHEIQPAHVQEQINLKPLSEEKNQKNPSCQKRIQTAIDNACGGLYEGDQTDVYCPPVGENPPNTFFVFANGKTDSRRYTVVNGQTGETQETTCKIQHPIAQRNVQKTRKRDIRKRLWELGAVGGVAAWLKRVLEQKRKKRDTQYAREKELWERRQRRPKFLIDLQNRRQAEQAQNAFMNDRNYTIKIGVVLPNGEVVVEEVDVNSKHHKDVNSTHKLAIENALLRKGIEITSLHVQRSSTVLLEIRKNQPSDFEIRQ